MYIARFYYSTIENYFNSFSSQFISLREDVSRIQV